jgi:hypothetical protein
MNISYGRTAYVCNCGRDMLEKLKTVINSYAEGNENLSTTLDELENMVEEWHEEPQDAPDADVQEFIKKVVEEIDVEVGDVIFSK